MYKNLRIVFTVLSAICLAAAIPLGIFFDYVGIVSTLLGAGIFFMLMLLCKQSQEFAEQKAEKAAKAKESGEADENADAEMTVAPQKKLSKTAVTKPPKYKRKK